MTTIGTTTDACSPMTQAISASYLTLEQYLEHTAGTDTRCELVNGLLVKMPPESVELGA